MTDHKSFVFRFGDIEVREREFLLIRAGEALPVEPKAFRVLLFLLRNPGRLVSKDEILNAVWNDCSVSDNSLTRSVATLRRLLNDDPREPRYIATVQTLGYRLLCPVQAIAQEAVTSEAGTNGTTRPLDDGRAHGATEEEGRKPDASRRKRAQILFAGSGVALLIILVGGFLVYGVIRGRAGRVGAPSVGAARSTGVRYVPLTSVPGLVSYPAFSPDGQKIAFFWDADKATPSDLYIQLVGGDVQLVGGEKPLRLTHTPSGFLCCANWSPDGRQIAFTRCDDYGGGIYVVPALGGPERKITDAACLFGYDGYPTWTLDGASLLLADRCVPDGPRGIVQFSLATGEKRCLTTPPTGGDSGDIALALSPDGKTVAFIRSSTISRDEICTIEVSGNHLKQLTHDGQSIANHLMWAADGQYIIFDSSRDGGTGRPWRVPAAGGAIEQETIYPRVGTLSRDGRRLAYVEESGLSRTIWRAELASSAGRILSLAKIIASSSGNDSPQLSTDEQKIVFRSGSSIWTSKANGDNRLQLTVTARGFAGTPRWSPDGKWIVFDYRITAHSQIFMVDAEGRNLHSVTAGDYENDVPSWSRDGSSIYFASNRTGNWQVWNRKLATGEETQVTRNGGHAAFESYDAKMLYYAKFDGAGIWSVPVAGGTEQRVTDALHRGYWGHFAVTDGGIYLLDTDAPPRPTVMYYSFQTKRLTPVFQITEHPLTWNPGLSASRDGRTVLFAQFLPTSSITMVDNLQ